MRTLPEPLDVIAAVRTMYKRVGIDPTKTRPSSEALLRRVRKGDELPAINSLVDIINWCSLETQLPFGLYDLDRIQALSCCDSAARARSTRASARPPCTSRIA
jgi:DNA/RNA-binding domain of Phe-tRNA-synthetase-like protein